jgi:hypothetical protein
VTPEEIDEHLEMGDVLYWLETKFLGHFRMAKSYCNTCGAIALMFGLIGCGLAFFPKFASTNDPLARIDSAALGAMLPIVERGQAMDSMLA